MTPAAPAAPAAVHDVHPVHSVHSRAAAQERAESERARLAALTALLECRASRLRLAAEHLTHNKRPLDFARYPFQREIYEDLSREINVCKCSQVGISEWLIVDALAVAAIGHNVIYCLPDDKLVGRFVQVRIDKPLAVVPFYQRLLKLSVGETDRIGLKLFGDGTLYVQGSGGETTGTSDAADQLTVDEYDLCDPETLELLDSRLRASALQRVIRVSNPRRAAGGIAELVAATDARKWHIVCPRCTLAQPLDWYVHAVEAVSDGRGNVLDYRLRDRAWTPKSGRDAQLPCRQCGEPLPRLERDPSRAFWKPTNPEGVGRGYYLTSLFSPDVTVAKLWTKFHKAQGNPTALSIFHIMDLGLPYAPPGAQVTRELLEACIHAGWRLPVTAPADSRGATMGVDVGKFFHVRISDRPGRGIRRALYIGRVRDEQELLALAKRYRVRAAVIDELPETRKVRELVAALRRQGVKAWRIGGTGAGASVVGGEDSGHEPKLDEAERRVVYGRTLLLDDAMEDLLLRRNILPLDALTLDEGEYAAQLCRNSRVLVTTARGAQLYRWSDEKPNDHRFADAYDKLAGHPLLAGRSLFFDPAARLTTGGRLDVLREPAIWPAGSFGE
jgi:hypothetical protein